MACDRFVYFEKGKVPPLEDIGKVLEDYLGAVLSLNRCAGDRFMVHLQGIQSWPFRRVADPDSEMAKANREEAKHEHGRWIEVVFGDDNIDVLTRRQDELVNNIASGFAKLVARYWHGRLEMDE